MRILASTCSFRPSSKRPETVRPRRVKLCGCLYHSRPSAACEGMRLSREVRACIFYYQRSPIHASHIMSTPLYLEAADLHHSFLYHYRSP